MAGTVLEPLVSTPRKRNHEGEIIANTTSMNHAVTAIEPTMPVARHPSPTPSEATSELTELTSTDLASPKPAVMDVQSSFPTPAKKHKLTFAEKAVEKAVKQQEREDKARQKAEEKVRKDEEKRKREEDKEASKRAKELALAEKKKARDVERSEKEAEKARKEAERKEKEMEKTKKERSQLRIGAFFGRPAPQSTPPTTPDDIPSGVSSRRSSIAAADIETTVSPESSKPANPDFEKYIIPYFVHENTEIAPLNRFKAARKADILDENQPWELTKVEGRDIETLRSTFGPPRKRLRTIEPVKSIVERVQATQIDGIDSDHDFVPLNRVVYKILSFREDVRPPYLGTYTKSIAPSIALRLSRRPHHRGQTDTNYDYDSEAEWEEPAADDEEILDDEMSESEDGDEEMQDFLDDEDDHARKRMFAGEMEPVNSGLCFQGDEYDSNGHDLNEYRMDVLHDSVTFPIDPFSTAHWADAVRPVPVKVKSESNIQSEASAKPEQNITSMPPPRAPLAAMGLPNKMVNYLATGSAVAPCQNENAQATAKLRGRPPNLNKEVKMIPAEFIDAFKKAVDGSDLTKAGLVEILKKQFPKCSKDAIKDTLGLIAVRVGKKEAEKKWALV